MNASRLKVLRAAPAGTPTTAAGRARATFRARQRQAAATTTGLRNAAEAAARTPYARASPGALDPTGRLDELQDVLAANDLTTAGKLLDAMLTDLAGPNPSGPGAAQRPRNRRMSDLAFTLTYMAL